MEINWDSRYSETMDNDKHGRWARVAFIGSGIDSVEVAWIKKIYIESFNDDVKQKYKDTEYIFSVNFEFPRKGECIFDTLEDAMKQVEIDLLKFKSVLN